MKQRTRIGLALLLLLACTACGKTEAPPADTTVPTETAAPVTPTVTFIGGENTYTITRSEVPSEDAVNAAKAFYKGISAVTDKPVNLGDDWLRSGTEPPAYEILVGEVNRPECREAMTELPYSGYLIKVMGEKLVIVAGDDAYLDDAIDYLLANHLTADGLTLPADFSHSEDLKPGGYPLANATLGAHKLSDYAIYAADRNTAIAAQRIIGDSIGRRLPIVDSRDGDMPLLILGKSAKADARALPYYAYAVETDGKSLYFNGAEIHAVKQALGVTLDHLKAAPSNTLTLEAACCSYTLPDREAYIENIDLLYMRWAYDFTPDPALLDFAAKKEAIFGGKGTDTLYASAHRAEWGLYPENSIEAVISNYRIGAAIAELDFGATRDGVLILMHDNNLTRMTNCDEYIGKPGYPTSANVSDWTYEQIQVLNLKEGGGGSGARLTPFKVATVEEALKVCKDRLFIVPDKQDNWQYVKSDNIMRESKKLYLSDLMKKTGNYDSILISYGQSSANYLTANEAIKLQQLLTAETGVVPMILIRVKPDAALTNYNLLTQKAAPNSFALQLNGNYNPNTDYEAATRQLGDKQTFLAWTIGTGADHNDTEDVWSRMYKLGLRIIMTNDLLGFMQYSARINAQ